MNEVLHVALATLASSFLTCFSLSFIPDLPAEEQAEPGSEQQAAAAERQPQQEEPGGSSNGATASRAPTAALEEESCPAAKGEPAGERTQLQ